VEAGAGDGAASRYSSGSTKMMRLLVASALPTLRIEVGVVTMSMRMFIILLQVHIDDIEYSRGDESRVAEPEPQGAASFWWSRSRNAMRLRLRHHFGVASVGAITHAALAPIFCNSPESPQTKASTLVYILKF
jgi:hypothetical protein